MSILETITDAQTARLEESFAYGTSWLLHRQRRELLSVGIERAAEQDDAEWKRRQEEAAAALYLLLRRPWELAFNGVVGSRGVTVKPGRRDGSFVEWAGPYSDRLGRDIVETNRRVVQKVAEVRAQGGTVVDPRLLVLSSVDRITNISITETTRSLSAGEDSAASVYQAETGKMLIAYWNTERDERVCKICGPLDNEPSTAWRHRFGAGPPAHPRCRCRLDWRDV